MKKLPLFVITICLLLSFYPQEIQAAATAPASQPISADSTTLEVLTLRLNELKGLDKSEMNAPEKQEIRREVRKTKKEINSIGNGVYLSGGAILVIILVLILIL
ncbi:MAG: hypothetical protein NWR72_17765 [Bacteroidia bacterium]|nr:hypothetical protein [Bacteroidia bacterium]